MELPSLTCKRCGLIDEVLITQQGVHVRADCRGCGAFIKFVPQGAPPVLYFGKYKGREISSLTSKEEVRYLQWLTIQPGIKPNIKNNIDNYLKTL
jgi:hypothetical protein